MDRELRQIVIEECWRSVAWAALGLASWAFISTETTSLDPTITTLTGLTLLTWALLTVSMIGARLVTGAELNVTTRGGLVVILLISMSITAIIVLLLYLTTEWSKLFLGGAYLGLVAATIVYYRLVVFPDIEATVAE